MGNDNDFAEGGSLLLIRASPGDPIGHFRQLLDFGVAIGLLVRIADRGHLQARRWVHRPKGFSPANTPVSGSAAHLPQVAQVPPDDGGGHRTPCVRVAHPVALVTYPAAMTLPDAAGPVASSVASRSQAGMHRRSRPVPQQSSARARLRRSSLGTVATRQSILDLLGRSPAHV